MQPLTNRFGLTDPFGLISSDSVYFVFNGKVLSLQDTESDANWLSQTIHSLIASANPGQNDFTAFDESYLGNLRFATGTYQFIYNKTTGGWNMYSYGGKTIRLLDNINPYTRTITGWVGTMGQHTAMTVAEEDITPDYLLSVDGKKLAVMNHFCNDDGAAITMTYETRYDACGRPDAYKRFQKIKLQGTPSTDYTISYMAVDYPQRMNTVFSLAGTLTTNSTGYGEINIDALGVYISVQVKESSTNMVEIFAISVEYVQREII
jgi:hypothetical protein